MESIQKMGEVFVVSDVPRGTAHGEQIHLSDKKLDVPYSNPSDDKRAWLKENFPNLPKENIIFCSCKWMVVGDILVDDKPDTFLAFRERGRDVILMDMPYNRHIDTKWRAANLKEAEEMIAEILMNKQSNSAIL
jgi:5'(3')-deoxyribonucleotidase